MSRVLRAVSRIALEERELLAQTFWSLFVRVGGMAASFVVGVQLARRLNPAGFGIYGIIIALALVVSVVAQFGLQTVATRDVSVALAERRWGALRGYVDTFAKTVLAISAALALLWILAALVFPDHLGSRRAHIVGALLVPLYALTVLASAELRALGKIVTGQMMEVLVRPILMCMALVGSYLVSARLTAALALWLQVGASTVTLFIAVLWLRSALPLPAKRVSPVAPTGWLRPAAALAAVDLLRQIDATYGILLLGALSSETEAGYFRVALSTVIVVATPLSIFNVVLAPSLARLHSAGDQRRLQRIMSVSAIVMFTVTLLALLVVALVGKPLIVLLFGSSFGPSWVPLLLLICAQLINGFFGLGWVLLSMSGGERTLTTSFVASVCVSVIVAIPLILLFSARGAAAAAIVGALIQNILAWRGVRLHSSLESSAAGFFRQERNRTARQAD